MVNKRYDLFNESDMDALFEEFMRAKARANQLNRYFPNARYSPRIDLLRGEVRVEPLCAVFERTSKPSRNTSNLIESLRQME
jgi:hypothetical protein